MKILNIIRKTEKWVVVLGMGLMTLVTVYAVFNRFVLKQSIQWSDEFTRYVFIWVSLIGSSIAVERNAHVGVSIFVDLFPPKLKKLIYVLSNIICILFCIVLAYTGVKLSMSQSNQYSAAMRINMMFIFLSLPVSFLLMCMNYIVNVYDILTNKEIERHEEVIY